MRISTILALHAPDTCSRNLLKMMSDLASQRGEQAHTHLAQSAMEVAQVKAREGMTPAEFLDDVGLLMSDLVTAHCIFIDETDVRRVGRARAMINYAPIGKDGFCTGCKDLIRLGNRRCGTCAARTRLHRNVRIGRAG
ncbi:MAG: amidohydrolase family protein [Paracoccaceae bacterium]|nr:amidohydrolase family protein [Paracoccaceae bacterium]